MLTRKYHKNIDNLFIFNATLWLRTAMAFVVPMGNKLWESKLHFLDNLADLHTCIDPNQLLIQPGLVQPQKGVSGVMNMFKSVLG